MARLIILIAAPTVEAESSFRDGAFLLVVPSNFPTFLPYAASTPGKNRFREVQGDCTNRRDFQETDVPAVFKPSPEPLAVGVFAG